MKKHPLDDLELYPPFEGFPPEGIAFLRRLKKNNTRPWFQRHRDEYEELVRFPMQCLVASLARQMADQAPEFAFDPRTSIFRIYRDVRFSKNKAPYKTNIAASFDYRGKGSPTETPGLYVGIEPGETTADGVFTLLPCACLGMCGDGPAMMVGENLYGRVTPEGCADILEKERKTP